MSLLSSENKYRPENQKPESMDVEMMMKEGEEKFFEKDLDAVLGRLRMILLSKNKKYGDSALNPLRIFSKTSPDEQIKVRIDDKLKRIINNNDGDTEDPELDLLGYIVLLRIYKLRESRKNND